MDFEMKDRIIGDEWPINVGLTNPPTDWDTMDWYVDIGLHDTVGSSPAIREDLTVSSDPEYDGYLTGTVSSTDTETLQPGIYYIQLSMYDGTEPQSSLEKFKVIQGFDRS